MFIDPLYIVTLVVCLLLGGLSTWYVNSTLKKYNKVSSGTELTGAQIAKNMLSDNGIYDVQIHEGRKGRNHFDPRNNSVTLETAYFHGTSVSAHAVACHEVGHALQLAVGYGPFKARSAIFPVVSFASNVWFIIFIVGAVMTMNGLIDLAIALYAVTILFQIVTLPVEFDASKRAMDYIKSSSVLQGNSQGAFSVLRSCALTYVAAALVSLIQLLYLLSNRN